MGPHSTTKPAVRVTCGAWGISIENSCASPNPPALSEKQRAVEHPGDPVQQLQQRGEGSQLPTTVRKISTQTCTHNTFWSIGRDSQVYIPHIPHIP
eukprot:CAMPEP_0173315376 /NCGR_PEP_ID=MMETSP1143-20121109/25875_1 /TAXON_ID=483371 /ORGANISM="non described non described, Strain CCMP2298" /LENGTH=95 /DNA_ID=CAMNT_0014258119 /DNA_START=64 /DNA_END=348 /DNA_ORIENTATION=+